MNVVVLAAGLGTRLRPHTLHRPKPLLHVGGGTLLSHLRRALAGVPVDETVFVVGHLGEQIRADVTAHWDVGARFVVQRELRGQAHALILARAYVSSPSIVVLPDMVFRVESAALSIAGTDGVIFGQRVADPRRFGVVVTDGAGHALRFVEKPDAIVSDLAIAGLYVLRDGPRLVDACERLVHTRTPRHGEHYLADALQLLVDDGARLAVRRLQVWEDCGTPADLLRTNRHLLSRIEHRTPAQSGAANVIVPPVSIDPTAAVTGSRIGPFVHVGPACRLREASIGPHVSLADRIVVDRSTLADCIVEADARIADSALRGSLVGRSARIDGFAGALDIGDHSRIGTPALDR